MGKLVQENFVSNIKNFINNYEDIKINYENKYNESLNKEPYDSINNFPMKECKYKISVVMSTWNSGNTILYTLKSIEKSYLCQSFNEMLEVIVVDDGSNDNTEEIVLKESFNFKLKFIKQLHMGRAQGINMACKHAEGDMIIFCDSDIILFPFTIDEIVKRQQEYLDEAIFFGFREDIEEVCELEHLTKFIYEKQPCFWYDNRFSTDFNGSWGYNMMSETNMLLKLPCLKNFWVSNNRVSMYDCWQLYRMVYGFLFSVSKKNFEKVGGFVEFLVGWGCDDTSFVSLCIEQGIKVIPIPSATCCHIKHPIRMKSQWEDGKKNEERMNAYLSNNKRIDFLDQDFVPRILKKEVKDSNNKNNKNLKRYKVNFQTNVDKARYYYYIGNFAKALKLYLLNYNILVINDLEKLYECMIRENNDEYLNKINNKEKEYCYFYYLAYYYFNKKYKSINLKSYNTSVHIKYLYNLPQEEHLKRAKQYFEQGDYFLSLMDYFGMVLLGNYSYLEKCNECIKEIKSI